MYCKRCLVKLPDVDAASPWAKEESPQRENVLVVELQGGYGMFGDWMGEEPQLALCHDCGAALCGFLGFAQRGLHPYDDEPCCKFGWRIRDGEVEFG